ncbi:MAG TPA: DMT family transporter [Candidatus Competibacteraceae bacterium]|nr:DMT family transporter [Candidatus Competibacteraceae bacterium]
MNLPAAIRSPSPYLLLVFPPLFWAGNFVLGRAVRADIPPFALSFWRWTVALIILLPFVLPHMRAQRTLLRAHFGRLLVLSVLGVASYNTLAYIGLQQTTATNAVLMVSTTPVLIVGVSFLLLRQTIHLWQGLGILVSLAGVAAIVLKGDLTSLLQQQLNPGDFWIFAAGVSWAGYSVLLVKWRPTGLHPLSFLGFTIAFGVLAILPLYLWDWLIRGHGFIPGPVTLGSIGYVAVFPSVLAYIFWNRAVTELGANRCGQFLHLMPAFGTVLSWLLLGERLYAYHWLGIGLIAAGIYLATMLGRR